MSAEENKAPAPTNWSHLVPAVLGPFPTFTLPGARRQTARHYCHRNKAEGDEQGNVLSEH